MTRTHAARQLLRLGPLTWGEFITVTGWSVSQARRTLDHLMERGEVVFRGSPRVGSYQLQGVVMKQSQWQVQFRRSRDHQWLNRGQFPTRAKARATAVAARDWWPLNGKRPYGFGNTRVVKVW